MNAERVLSVLVVLAHEKVLVQFWYISTLIAKFSQIGYHLSFNPWSMVSAFSSFFRFENFFLEILKMVHNFFLDYRISTVPLVDAIDGDTYVFSPQAGGDENGFARGAWDWDLLWKRIPLTKRERVSIKKTHMKTL